MGDVVDFTPFTDLLLDKIKSLMHEQYFKTQKLPPGD